MHGALASVAVLFSLNYIFGKIALRSMEPLLFVWLRVAGSAILLEVLRRAMHVPPLPRAYLRKATLYSLLGVVINQLMFISGLALTTAHEAAILITTIPIFTLIGAVITKAERTRAANLLGIAIAAAGALIILQPGGHATLFDRNRIVGDLLIIINCASYGTYLVASKKIMRELPAVSVIAALFAIGTGVLLPFCLPALFRARWTAIPPSAWLALAAVIVGPTVVAYLLNGWALARANSTVVAAYTYAQPFIASLLAVIFLGEHLRLAALGAGVLIVIGVALSSRRALEKAAV